MPFQDKISPIWTVGNYEFQVIIGRNDNGRVTITNQVRRVGQTQWTLVMEADIDAETYKKFNVV